MRLILLVWLLVSACTASAATKILVTVIEQKSGKPVTGLSAGDFQVLDEKTVRRVEAAEWVSDILDVMLLLDSSLAGEMVRPVAGDLIAQLQPKEQMAVVAFHSSADLIQEFTSSRQLLSQAVSKVRYGNSPKLLDALYAAIRDGFTGSSFRRAILLLTTGVEGYSRVSEREVVRAARRAGVTIYPVYMIGYERSLFENLARSTGGASFNLRDMKRASEAAPGPRIFEVIRSHYVLSVAGNLGLGERIKVEVKSPAKVLVSALPME